MTNGNRDWATRLGHLVRWLVALASRVPVLVGFGLVVYGVSLWSIPAAYVTAGVFVLFLVWPRPDRRK